MNKSNSYLFLLTISPVQSFIEQARKAQDLFAGSRILSELTKAGIDLFPDEQIIFPKTKGDSLPNRFIANFTGTEDEARAKGKEVEDAVRIEWDIIARNTAKKAPTGYHKEGFNQQINQLLDIHWAFKEIDNDYQTAYGSLEALVGSIKNVRAFEQYSYDGIGEQGRKCSLDGERNALFYRNRVSDNGRKSSPSHIRLNAAVEVDKNELNPGEGLSAVSFVKRFYKSEEKEFENFPSTAEIALMHDESEFYKRANEKEKADFEQYKKIFVKNDFLTSCLKLDRVRIESDDIKKLQAPFDYQALYKENINKENYTVKLQFDLVKDCFENSGFSKYFRTKYYALIIFDGDSMGKKLSSINSPEDHGDLSQKLAEFAKLSSSFLDGNAPYNTFKQRQRGRAIYAGGDDFLGMVNVHDLFEVMTALRLMFDEEVSKKLNANLQPLTFSAGIVIAHYKMPLAEVLKTARKTEKKAKNDGDRNAFAITAMKHSGEIQETILKWGDSSLTNIWETLGCIIGKLKDDTFSSKFITNLTTELYQLAGRELESLGDVPTKAIESEFKRLVKNALKNRQGAEADKKEVNDLCEKLAVLFENRKPNEQSEKFKAIQNFIHALLIADFLTRKTTQDQ
jgi:CRISPR-associated protein Cmr2